MLVLFEPGVASFAERVLAGALRAGTKAVASTFDAALPHRLLGWDLVIVGAPAAVLAGPELGRRTNHQQLTTSGAPSLRSWLRALPSPATSGLTSRRAAEAPYIAPFDVRVSRGPRHPSTSSNVVARVARGRGYELATLPTSFLISAADLTASDRELVRAERWAHGAAHVAWASRAGKRPSWWLSEPVAAAS